MRVLIHKIAASIGSWIGSQVCRSARTELSPVLRQRSSYWKAKIKFVIPPKRTYSLESSAKSSTLMALPAVACRFQSHSVRQQPTAVAQPSLGS